MQTVAGIAPKVKARMEYALRVYAAVYGHRVEESADACVEREIMYGGKQPAGNLGEGVVWIPARYAAEERAGVPKLEKRRYAGEELWLAHGVEEESGRPDWLGEIFEWISGSLEAGIEKRDTVGRIPYAETVFAKQGISPMKAHASAVMAWLENAVRNRGREEALPRAESPAAGVRHMVVASHDVDFYFTGKRGVLERTAKNLGIAVTLYKSASFFTGNLKLMGEALQGKRPGDYIPGMLAAMEENGFRSTLFAVAGGEHRRDPNYRIEEIAPQLKEAARRGFSVGLHASYASVIEGGTVPQEARELERATGLRPRGSRQHWLRFDEQEKLQRNLERAGFDYDSSLGFSETCGFRNGASFAFPPYDFTRERACEFLELPLAVMDGSLEINARETGEGAQEITDRILAESRRWGWGGISVLWHNPMEAIQVPEEVNRVFWESAKRRRLHGEEWMSGDDFLRASLERYHGAGLLKEMQGDA